MGGRGEEEVKRISVTPFSPPPPWGGGGEGARGGLFFGHPHP